jgi:hypothetical protein
MHKGVYRRVTDDTAVVGMPKDQRDLQPGDEKRLWDHVRSLPCARCWKEGRTEVSHSNWTIDGKGRSLKAYPWRVAALCHECHAMIDQGKDMGKGERMEAWDSAHRWTLGQLFERHLVRPV